MGGAPAPPRPRLYLHAALSLARRAPPPHPRPYYPCEPRPFAAGVSRAAPPPSSFRGVSSPPPRETLLGCKNLPNSGKKGFEVPSITFWGVSSCPPPNLRLRSILTPNPKMWFGRVGSPQKGAGGGFQGSIPPNGVLGRVSRLPTTIGSGGVLTGPPPPLQTPGSLKATQGRIHLKAL